MTKKMKRGGKLGVLRGAKFHEPHLGGLLHTYGPGRTDNLHVKVAHNSYIVPADVVSGLGQGNTLAGGKFLDSVTGVTAKMPTQSGAAGLPTAGKMPGHFASGGHGNGVDIIVAGGEYNVPPEAVAKLGKKALDEAGHKDASVEHHIKAGHKILDSFVEHVRKKTINEMKNLPGPKK